MHIHEESTLLGFNSQAGIETKKMDPQCSRGISGGVLSRGGSSLHTWSSKSEALTRTFQFRHH